MGVSGGKNHERVKCKILLGLSGVLLTWTEPL